MRRWRWNIRLSIAFERPITDYAALMTVRRERFVLLVVLLGGLAIRLPFIAADPHVSGDLGIIVGWAERMASGGLAELLARTQVILYPPLAMLELWLGGVLGAPLVIAKLAPLLADLALGWLVWRMLRQRGPRIALLGAAAIVFNPAFWFLSATWGQIDSVYVLLMVASVAALAVDRFGTAWATWTAGVLWKLQALVIGPLVVVATARRAGWRGLDRGVPAALAVLIFSFIAFRVLLGGGLVEYARRLWHGDDELVISAFNGWFLARPVIARGPEWFVDLVNGGAAWLLGWALVGVVSLIVMRAAWLNPSRQVLALGAAALALAPFVLLIGMRERYLLAAIPFFLLFAAGWGGTRRDRAGVLAFVAISFSQYFNLVAVASIAPDLWVNVFATEDGPLTRGLRIGGYGMALLNLVVLAWAVLRLSRVQRLTGIDPKELPERPLGDDADGSVAS